MNITTRVFLYLLIDVATHIKCMCKLIVHNKSILIKFSNHIFFSITPTIQ